MQQNPHVHFAGAKQGMDKTAGRLFCESPINFLTAMIWFLRKYREGEYCTLPHVIELMQVEYDRLFTFRTEKEIEVLINPFVYAYLNGAMEQLEGQIASAKIVWQGWLHRSCITFYQVTTLRWTSIIRRAEDCLHGQ